MKTPLLLIGDSPSCTSGLGRILRDLALRIHANIPEYEVASFGYGGPGDKNLPFYQYQIEGMKDWFLPTLPDVWANHADGRKGAIMSIWDASRLLWFARPDNKEYSPDPLMRGWLATGPFKKWGYFPQDACGPRGGLSYMNAETMAGFDRMLAYTKWGEGMIRKSLTGAQCDAKKLQALPHGIDTDLFRPVNPAEARKTFFSTTAWPPEFPPVRDDERIIGIIATNQARKDWGLAIEAVAALREIPFRLYIQIDTLTRHWDIATLLRDYGILGRTIINVQAIPDTMMPNIYSMCDLTLGIGPEGFGYPIFESLACGTPCLAGSYGGQAEFMAPEMLIDPVCYRVEGLYDAVRPVHSPEVWTRKIAEQLKTALRFEKVSLLPQDLEWKNLWPRWEKWFRESL